MVAGNGEENKNNKASDDKANTTKTNGFEKLNNVFNASCSKLHELSSCQKVAHSVIFYVFIFILILVLVYIFRKLVSIPNTNGRKHTTNTTLTATHNVNNHSLSKGFSTVAKWPKLNTVVNSFQSGVPATSYLGSAREKKTHIYGIPEYSTTHKKFNYYNLDNYKTTENPFSSSNNELPNQENTKQQAPTNIPTHEWLTSKYIGHNEYGKASSDVPGLRFSYNNGYTNDWSSQRNNDFKAADSIWENSWNNEPSEYNSNLAKSPHSKISAFDSGNVKTTPVPIGNTNDYGRWDSWVKWGQTGSGFSWIKANDYDNNYENSYKSRIPNRNDYYYESASGKWSYKNNDNQNLYRPNRNEISNPNNWNSYGDYWNETPKWENFDASDAVSKVINDARIKQNVLSNEKTVTNNANKLYDKTKMSTWQDENIDEQIHRWPPLEYSHEIKASKLASKAKTFHNRKKSKSARRQNRKAKGLQNIKNSHNKLEKIVKKKRHQHKVKKTNTILKRYQSRKNEKSFVSHPQKARASPKASKLKTILRKHIPGKVTSYKKQTKRTRHSKLTNRESRLIVSHRKHMTGKWQRKVHHIKHCKNLQSFHTNGKVQLNKKFLHKQRKYKYTVLSCRYVLLQNSRKKRKDFSIDEDMDDIDLDSDFVDEDDKKIPLKRKQICRKFWFITNGRLLLKKTPKANGVISYTISLCRARDKTRQLSKIKTDHYLHQSKSSNYNDLNDNNRINRKHNLVMDQVDNDNKRIMVKLTKHQQHNEKMNDQNDDTDTKDDDIENDFQTENRNIETKQSNHNNVDDDKNFDKGTASDIDDDIDVDPVSPINSKFTHRRRHKTQKSDEHINEDNNKDVENHHTQGIRGTHHYHYNNEHAKIDPLKQIQQNNNPDDIDDIDDTGTDTRTQGKINSDANDDTLEGDSIDDDLNDDMDDNDIMNTYSTTSYLKQPFLSRLHTARKARIRHKAMNHHQSTGNTYKTGKKDNLYERLLSQLSKYNYSNDKSNDLKSLLLSIMQMKVNSAVVPKDVISKKPQTQFQDTKNSDRKHTFVSHNAQNDTHINNLLKSVIRKSLSQAINRKSQQTTNLLTPEPHTKSSMAELLQYLLPNGPTPPGLGTTPSTTHKPITTPTKPDEQIKIQFANILKKFGIRVPEKTQGHTSIMNSEFLKKDVNNGIVDNDRKSSASQGSANERVVVNPSVSSLPSASQQALPQLSPLPSKQLPEPQQLLSPTQQQMQIYKSQPYKIQQQQQQQQQQQKQQQQQQQQQQKQQQQQQQNEQEQQPQLLTVPLPKPPQQNFSMFPTNLGYPSRDMEREQTSVQRSFIPTIKPQQIIHSALYPQSQRQLGNRYGYSSYSTNSISPYWTQRAVNVLCFGDSLTSGYYNHGRSKHPYSIRLNQLLNPQGTNRYHIETRGVTGEMVHGRMTKRLPKVLKEGKHFDWVLILGGTNDVAHVKNFGDDQDFTQQLISVWSPKIVKDIEKLHEISRSYGARTVLMTIPETAYELWRDFRSIRNMRLSVNAALRKYATEVTDTTVLCDLAYKLPRSTLSQQMQKLYWNDHIHLNPVGYDKMGEIIQQCIQPYLS